MSEPLIPVSSSWVVVDGYVWSADTLPKLPPGQGKGLSAARLAIRKSIAERWKR